MVEKAVRKLPDVKDVSVSLLTNSMAVEGDASDEEIVKAVEDAGYGAKPRDAAMEEDSSEGAKKAGSVLKAIAAEEDALKDRETPKLLRRLKLSHRFPGGTNVFHDGPQHAGLAGSSISGSQSHRTGCPPDADRYDRYVY
jgi:hypothetical protein